MDFKKIRNRARKTILGVGLTGSLYLAGIVVPQKISMNGSPNITTQSQLEELIKQERVKIDPENKSIIYSKLVEEDKGISRKLSDGKYSIFLGGIGANESTLRHELYHILDGHCEDGLEDGSNLKKFVKYLFHDELQATIYQSTGLKF